MNSLLQRSDCRRATLPLGRGVLWQQLERRGVQRATSFAQCSRGKATEAVKPPPVVRRRKIEQVRRNKKQDQEYPYGLYPVDYSKPPPLAPRIIPPPPKPGFQRLLAPFMMVLFVGFGVYIYYNNDPEMYEYWKRVETGAILIDDDDDEDDDDDDDDDDES